ncbi:MAG TPA: ATP-binding cassette domain-containing protein [Candidatus Dormibacteraeota bacterium]|nr:ATP-binding cassette domain-containing protein [Candidatus Dormibacteraeota bacterium]
MATSVPNVIAKLDDISLSYGEKVILKNCSLDIVEGAITCIIGLSGAGKSTIVRLLDGLSRPQSGHVYHRGVDICHISERQLMDVRRKISLSFQFAALLDSLSIGDNVALPLQEQTHLSESEIQKIVVDALDSVGLSNTYDNLPSQLSGGMLKRAGFARAIVTRPELILYDEPTTGLDPIVTHLITDTIVRLRQKLQGTAVVISHDLQSIYMMADYVAMLFEGAIIAYGTVDEIKQSPNPIVQQFIQGSEIGPIPI